MDERHVVQTYRQTVERLDLPAIGPQMSLANAQRLLQIRLQLIERLCTIRELQGRALRAQAEIGRIERDYQGHTDAYVQMDLEGRKRVAQAQIMRAQEMIGQYELEAEVFRAMIAECGG